MTLSDFLATLADRVLRLESRVSEIPVHEPSTGACAADLARLQGDIASLHAQVADLTAAFRANAAAISALRQGVDNATGAAELAAVSASRAKADVEGLGRELAEVKANQGDLAALPAL
jgi:chromosome segregation ATPase